MNTIQNNRTSENNIILQKYEKVTSQQSNINTSINCNNNMHTNISNNTYIPLQQRESTTHETTKSKYSVKTYMTSNLFSNR